MLFHLKEKIVGSKDAGSEAVTVIDPKSNIASKNAVEIRKISVDYCHQLLTNRQPNEGFQMDIEMNKYIHEWRMNDIIDTEHDVLTELVFNKTYNRLVKVPGRKYKFIMKADIWDSAVHSQQHSL